MNDQIKQLEEQLAAARKTLADELKDKKYEVVIKEVTGLSFKLREDGKYDFPNPIFQVTCNGEKATKSWHGVTNAAELLEPLQKAGIVIEDQSLLPSSNMQKGVDVGGQMFDDALQGQIYLARISTTEAQFGAEHFVIDGNQPELGKKLKAAFVAHQTAEATKAMGKGFAALSEAAKGPALEELRTKATARFDEMTKAAAGGKAS